jgi:hypothetical protein
MSPTSTAVDDFDQVLADLDEATPEPVLAGHARVLIGDLVLLLLGPAAAMRWAPQIEGWALLACVVLTVVVHGVSWWDTRGKVRAIRPSQAVAAITSAGRHASAP